MRTVPPHLRRGLLRLYIAINLPWIAWFGYELYDANRQYQSARGFLKIVWNDRLIGRPTAYDEPELLEWATDQERRRTLAIRALPVMPAGAPILYLFVVWVITGFRKSEPHTTETPRTRGLGISSPTSVWDALQQDPSFQEQRKLFEAMELLCEAGVDADEMPNGRGEFGTVASNPIPCRTVFGSTAYLGRLRTSDGSKVVYKRVGSSISDVSAHPVDAYEISHPNGTKFATLFMSPYQKRNSRKAPRGFSLVEPTEASFNS
jgi:hypothetical protein